MSTDREFTWLKEYFETRVQSVERLLCTMLEEAEDKLRIRLEAVDKSTSLAAAVLDKRMEGMNEVRAQLKDQALSFPTRTEMTLVLSKMQDEIDLLQRGADKAEGKASQQSVNIAYLISGISLLVGIIGIVAKFVK